MLWPVVNTLFQEKKKHHNRKAGSKGNTKIGRVLEVETSSKDFACRSKSKAKPQRRDPASSSPRTTLIEKRTWTNVEPGKYSLSDYDISEKLIHLLRHGQHMDREDDGAVQFWRIKEHLQNQFPQSIHWSDDRWKVCLAAGGGNKKRYQYCADASGTTVYLRALQGHSGRNIINLSLQDNVLIPNDFFEYIYHIGCAINLHPIVNSGLIPGGQNLSKRQTAFFTCVDPMDNHKDPDTIDLGAPRSIKHDQTLSFFTTHSQLVVFRKLFGCKLEKSYTRKYMRHLVLFQRSS